MRRVRASAKETFAHKGNWILDLKSVGLTPIAQIIEECSSKEEVIEREIHWIAEFRKTANITNLTGGGKDQTPFPKGDKNPSKNPEHKKRVSEMSRERAKSGILSVEAKARWADPQYRERLTNINRSRTRSPEFREKAAAHFKKYWSDKRWLRARPIIAISPSGEKIKFDAIIDAEKALGALSPNIVKVLQNKRSHAAGYRFQYADQRKHE